MTDEGLNDPLGAVAIAFRSVRGQLIEGQTIDLGGGQRGTWVITYTAGVPGLAPGGGLRIWREPHKFWLGQIKQAIDPTGQDYCSVSADGCCRAELVQIEQDYKTHAIAELRIVEGRLRPGEHIFFRVGDTSCGAPPAIVHPTRQPHCRFRVDVDADGTGQYVPLPGWLGVNVNAGKAARLSVVAPSHVRPGECMRAHLRFEDQNCNPGAAYAGRVSLTCTDPAAAFPEAVELAGEEDGLCSLPGVRLHTAGVHRVTARTADERFVRTSNPVRCSASKYGLWWGDLHCHADWVDGTRTAEENYFFARDESFLDVCAIAEHINAVEDSFKPGTPHHAPLDGHDVWAEEQRQAKAFYEPGRFVPIVGYEWTHHQDPIKRRNQGDHCIYVADPDQPLINHSDLSGLARLLSSEEALIIPHGHGRVTWTQDRSIDAAGERLRLLEIASMHLAREWFAQYVLRAGYRLGFTGGSDGHFGCPGYDVWPLHGVVLPSGKRIYSVQSALTGIYAETLTREAIWEALKERRVYATTGERILLSFKMDGHVMGQEYRTRDLPTIEAEVHGTAPIARMEIIRDDRLVHTEHPDGVHASLSWVDRSLQPGDHYYYLRATQTDGALAWSSPVWVSYAGPAGEDRGELLLWNSSIFPEERRDSDVDYGPQLRAFLAENDARERFVDLQQRGVFEEHRGRYALFWALDRARDGLPVRIHFYLDFRDQRVLIGFGWAAYGV